MRPDGFMPPERLTGKGLVRAPDSCAAGGRRGGRPGGPALELLDPAAADDTLVIEYSTGMRKQLGRAAALHPAPQLPVLDDAVRGRRPGRRLDDPHDPLAVRRGRGLGLFSSHVMALVERLCSHVAVISDGRVRAAGTLDEVRGDRSLEAAFVDLVGARDRGGRRPGVVGGLIRLKLRPCATGCVGARRVPVARGGGRALPGPGAFRLDRRARCRARLRPVGADVRALGGGLVDAPGPRRPGGDPLRPELFRLFPMAPRRLATGLLARVLWASCRASPPSRSSPCWCRRCCRGAGGRDRGDPVAVTLALVIALSRVVVGATGRATESRSG